MASFYAELEVEGHTYPVRWCQLGFEQATYERGRVQGKVRHRLLHLTLDVPDGDQLLAWANTPTKALAGHVTFFETNRLTARETVGFATGYCVGYEETFASGDGTEGAYVCRLVISTDKLVLTPGGPSRALGQAAIRDYATTPADALVAQAAPPLPDKLQRYTARMNMMQSARTKLATVPDDPAQNALTRLERNNVAVERAKLSAHVYKSDEFNLDEMGNPTTLSTPEPEGWHMLAGDDLASRGISPDMLLDPKSGFKAAIYQSSFEQPPKLVLAFAGTEDKKDIMADLRQGIGLEDKQYNQAMRLAKTLVSGTDPLDVETTGHSLGGGLASAATVVTGTKGYTFNAAGLHINTIKRAPYEVSRATMQEQGSLIDAYRSTSDPLNNAQKAAVVTRGVVLPKALGIPRLVAPAKQWVHNWSELVTGNPLTAAKNMALHGHGISPQMVDHIEAEKDVDTAVLTNYIGQ
ncbi:type VI secretion system tube protein TssD [Hymenobacter negativus]|uniref:Phospholipase n=1 Tax=Hymenobacter negativus TaxID=2795026 RepID=A0ABS3QQP4_9BACT|nr:type VI secretion system tube protein TssD [Hymenobacter negativus]MBO2013000.1 hypothetical protein [Hymenobacter negativus]